MERLTPFGVYETRDGSVALVAFQAEWFRNLAEAIGRPELAEDPRFAALGPRTRNSVEINAIIQDWLRQRTSAEVIHELQEKRGVPCAEVRTPQQVLGDPYLQARGAVVPLEHPGLAASGVAAMGMGLPIHFSGTPVCFDQPAQALGASNDAVYRGLLKIPEDELKRLCEQGVI